MKGVSRWRRRIIQPVLWLFYRWYFSQPRWYRYDGLRIRILPTVFHPGYFISTKTLLDFARQIDIKDRRVLELGAGSGMISLILARSGSVGTATDINPEVILAIRESMRENQIHLTLIESDLFDQISINNFDYIFINPPYFPKKPQDLQQLAFYCGEDFEFFRRLFSQLKSKELTAKIFMILNQHCALKTIEKIAENAGIKLELVHEVRRWMEWQYIFEIKSYSDNF